MGMEFGKERRVGPTKKKTITSQVIDDFRAADSDAPGLLNTGWFYTNVKKGSFSKVYL